MSHPTRRDILQGTAGLVGSALLGRTLTAATETRTVPSVKIDRIEAFPLVYPTKGRFKFFEDAQGNPLGRPTVVVKITADDGTVGWGQSVPTPKWSYETLETAYSSITQYIAPLMIGLDPFDEEAIHRAMSLFIAPSFSTGQPIAKAGLDLALFDLTGKLLGQSAYERWNKKGLDKILLSWTLNPKKLEDLPRLIDEGKQYGYHNFNVKVAPNIEFDVKMCRELRKLVPDTFLWADANGGYDVNSALEAAPKLADAGADVLEQPLQINRFTGYRKLKEQNALPIFMDEGIVSTVELNEFIEMGLLDGVAMKPARCGGINEAKRQIEMCLANDLTFLGSGLTDPDLSLAASLLLYGAFDLQKPAALNGPQFLSELSILKEPLVAKDGYMKVPTGPGLGVEIDEEKLRKHVTSI